MFDDHKQDQSQDNNGAQDSSSPMSMGGLGGNPSLSPFGSPSPAPSPMSMGGSPAPDPAPTPSPAPTTVSPVGAPSDDHGHPANYNPQLDDIKRQALSQLSPLVSQLDQSPEEKYKTLMMMIQASDNQDLLPEAYETAQKITDEKVKAEALLNIVNEINYFAQKGQ